MLLKRLRQAIRTRRRAGGSLIEVLAATLLVGLVVVGSLNASGAAWRSWQSVDRRLNGDVLAHALMREVLATRFEDTSSARFGLEADEPANPASRAAFDDVDDFHGWSASPPQSRDGRAIAGFTGWRESIQVYVAHWNDPTSTQPNTSKQGLKRIVVTITDPAGTEFRLIGLRSEAGALEQSTGVADSFVSGVQCDLEVDGIAYPHAGIGLLNHAEGP